MNKYCFILGISPRSGTNFLFRLLSLHDDCFGEGPIWEDFFVEHSKGLTQYSDNVRKKWSARWGIDDKIGGREKILECLGKGLLTYLDLQCDKREDFTYLISKTPSVKQLDNYNLLFPNSKLLLLVRDGRSVISSGEKTFDWGFELSCRYWVRAAKNIIKYEDENKLNDNYLVVKYENLYQDIEGELNKIFNFLSISNDSFSFEKAKSVGFIGSSENRSSKKDKMEWKEVESKNISDPLTRYSSWSSFRKKRYHWIAGKYHQRLGYDLDSSYENNFLDKLWNIILDSTILLWLTPNVIYVLSNKYINTRLEK